MSRQATFPLFKKKLVDQALQGGGFQVVPELGIPDVDTCGTYYGAQWLDIEGGLCFRMFRHAETAQGGRSSCADSRCDV